LHRLDDPDYVAREYATLDRFRMRRLDRTDWLRFDDDPEITVLLRAVDEIHPDRVLDAGCGDGWLTSIVSAPEVVAVRFVGLYNFVDHLAEVWAAVGRISDQDRAEFDCESGADELHRHFARVDCRPTSGSVVWLARDDLQAYLDAFGEMLGPLEAPDGRYPFAARRRNCVLVAETS
jgi:SAM-dependent methyltransferase